MVQNGSASTRSLGLATAVKGGDRMKQSVKRVAPVLVAAGTLLPAAQAFAQYESTDDNAALGAV